MNLSVFLDGRKQARLGASDPFSDSLLTILYDVSHLIPNNPL